MHLFRFPHAFLAVGAALCLASAAPAAPAPAEPPPAADLDKYLPDDAHTVGVLNVKQITPWTPFQKQLQDPIQQLLKTNEPLQQILKDTGFDPLRDLDRVVMVCAAGNGGPDFFLVEGKFDADKLEAKAKQYAKDSPGVVKSRMVGGIELWEIAQPGQTDHHYVAMLDKGTVMATIGAESRALEALDKANGKKKTDLKDKQVRDAVAKMDPKAALQVAASGDQIVGESGMSDGKGGVTTKKISQRDGGVESIHITVTLGDADVHGEYVMTLKDADKAKETAKSMQDGVDMFIKGATNAAQQMKELLPLVQALKTIKITTTGDTVVMEGNATPEGVLAGVKAFSTITSGRPGPPGPVPPETVTGGTRPPPPPVAPPPAPPKKDK